MKNVAAMGVLDRVAKRSEEVHRALAGLSPEQLEEPSALEGWSRLALLCHLRYGAQATRQMTIAGLSGRAAAFYPAGREQQRPGTLRPGREETTRDVIDSFARETDLLQEVWQRVALADWSLPVFELGETASELSMDLTRLALLRLTEVEVHGTDLNAGLGPWSTVFGPAVIALAASLIETWPGGAGVWLLRPHQAAEQTVVVNADGSVEGRPVRASDVPDVVVTGPPNSMVAVLFGRAPISSLDFSGDTSLIADLGEWVLTG